MEGAEGGRVSGALRCAAKEAEAAREADGETEDIPWELGMNAGAGVAGLRGELSCRVRGTGGW